MSNEGILTEETFNGEQSKELYFALLFKGLITILCRHGHQSCGRCNYRMAQTTKWLLDYMKNMKSSISMCLA